MVYLMCAFVNVFVLRQFGPLSAVAVTRLRLTVVGPTRRGPAGEPDTSQFQHADFSIRDRDASQQAHL
jgi:hypothetical protein